ncbi:MAG: zinc ribbon domain-containing protein [Acidobacteria bacterium]|nr:zinc ribbon domain-containing protein [Acidobacteriota bacterium]
MPLYEYECQSCGEHVERIQRVSDAPLSECPKCGGPLRKLLGVPALQFKGSGWYVTDYGHGNGKGEAAAPAMSSEKETAPKKGPADTGTSKESGKGTAASSQ